MSENLLEIKGTSLLRRGGYTYKIQKLIKRIANVPKLKESLEKAIGEIGNRRPLDEVNAEISRNIAKNHQTFLNALVNKK